MDYYEQLPTDPTQNHQNTINSMIESFNKQKSYTSSKIQNQGNPGKPVVSLFNCQTVKISKIDHYLQLYSWVNFKWNYIYPCIEDKTWIYFRYIDDLFFHLQRAQRWITKIIWNYEQLVGSRVNWCNFKRNLEKKLAKMSFFFFQKKLLYFGKWNNIASRLKKMLH